MTFREYASSLAKREGKNKSTLTVAQASEVLKIIRSDFTRATRDRDQAALKALVQVLTAGTQKWVRD